MIAASYPLVKSLANIDPCAVATLGEWIAAKRKEQRISQRVLAERIGTSPAYMSQIENSGTKLPGAALRRQIAAAFGVSHLDLLVAAGELTEDEVAAAGVVGVRPDHAPGSEQIHALVDQVIWTEPMIDWFTRMLREMIDLQSGAASPPASAEGQGDAQSR